MNINQESNTYTCIKFSCFRGPSGAPTPQRERDPSPNTLREMSQVKVTQDLLDYVQRTSFPYISDVSSYVKEEKIGQGTFGFVFLCKIYFPYFREVFKAKCKRTGKTVALKKILMENEKEGVSSFL